MCSQADDPSQHEEDIVERMERETDWESAASATEEPTRVTCVCGRSVLPENWSNHLLRQDGGPHRHAASATDAKRWAEAMSDPAFVAALEEGRSDIEAGRVTEGPKPKTVTPAGWSAGYEAGYAAALAASATDPDEPTPVQIELIRQYAEGMAELRRENARLRVAASATDERTHCPGCDGGHS